jgi:hypothetical protein
MMSIMRSMSTSRIFSAVIADSLRAEITEANYGGFGRGPLLSLFGIMHLGALKDQTSSPIAASSAPTVGW